jgi:cytidine deaminase
MHNEIKRRLVAAALECRELAYAPYSNFRVGAALLDDREQIHVGCNVENASYGLTICAERNAVAAAIASGARSLVAIAIASSQGVFPCGACRQVLFEFGPELVIWLVDADDRTAVREWTLPQLFPSGFQLKSQ